MPRSKRPVVHSVHFYDADEALIQRLQSVIASGIEAGNSVLVVATDKHRSQLAAALEKRGLEVSRLENDGKLGFSNAHETLTHFMVNGLPDRQLFLGSVGELVSAAMQSARNARCGLTVFGEMVAVLWEEGNKAGALQLEALWNDLVNEHTFHLHCAYPRSLFADESEASGIQAICEGHSHVVGYSASA